MSGFTDHQIKEIMELIKGINHVLIDRLEKTYKRICWTIKIMSTDHDKAEKTKFYELNQRIFIDPIKLRSEV